MSFQNIRDTIMDSHTFHETKTIQDQLELIEWKVKGAKLELLTAMGQSNILLCHHHINLALGILNFEIEEENNESQKNKKAL